MRTKEEINYQIKGLTKMRETLPQKTMFGDDNWKKIDAQISVLKGQAKPDDFYADEGEEEYQDGDNDVYNEAYTAKEWLDGNVSEDLFE